MNAEIRDCSVVEFQYRVDCLLWKKLSTELRDRLFVGNPTTGTWEEYVSKLHTVFYSNTWSRRTDFATWEAIADHMLQCVIEPRFGKGDQD